LLGGVCTKENRFLNNHSKKSLWFLAMFAAASFVWLIVRTGTKPSRISYPCQKAAVANINIFLVALGLPFLGLPGKLLHKRIFGVGVTAAVMMTGLLVIMAVSNFSVFTSVYVPEVSLAPLALNLQSQAATDPSSSNLFIIQNASGLQGDVDVAMSALLSSMQSHGLNFFNTSSNPSGLFGTNDVIILKVNGQSPQRGGTNTDLAKSLVKTILGHPEGFTGEVVIADNGQDTGGVDMTESNSYDHSQSMTDVTAMFPTYKVSTYSWYTLATKSVPEYSSGNYEDGYVVNSTSNAATGIKVSYPKFQTAYGTYISFKNGVWNQSNETYDSSRLKIINLPVFKSHYMFGATACVKNYMGVVSQTLTDAMDTVGEGGMGTEMVESRFPTLNIFDGIWINANPFQPGEQPGLPNSNCGPFTTYDVASYTNVIAASTDPVALEYWFAKNVAIPAAVQKGYSYTLSIDPDSEPVTQNLVQSYHHYLAASMNEIIKSGRQATMLKSEMNVYVTTLNTPTPTLPFADNFANLNSWTIVDGTWAIINGGVQGKSSAEALMYAGSKSWTTYQITAPVTIVAGGEASIVFRFSDSNNFYWTGIGPWGHQYSISKVVGGTYSEIVGSGSASSNGAGTYTLEAVVQGSTIKLYVNTNLVLTSTDQTFASGAIGLRTFGTTMQIERISVFIPAPIPTPTPSPTPTPTPTPTTTTTPTSAPTPTPTTTPSQTTSPTPISSPTPIASPTPLPTSTQPPTPTTTTPPTSTPTISSNSIPTSTSTPPPSTTTANPTPNPSQLSSPTPSPISIITETPLYIYAIVVLAIFAISISTIALFIKKKQ
jgi:hypothetical protein